MNRQSKVNLGVIITCVTLCAMLLVTGAVNKSRVNAEAPRAPADVAQYYPGAKDVLTETYLERTLLDNLPNAFPRFDPKITISENGEVKLGASIKRDAFTQYLQDSGVTFDLAGKAAMLLLPKTLDLSITFACTYNGKGGIAAVPKSVSIGGSSAGLDMLPADVFSDISEALSKSILKQYGSIEDVQFVNGAIVIN